MSKIKGEVRTSQLILTYGVGALVAVGEDSFIVAGLDHWDVNEDDELHEPRLERLLQVTRFYRPKSGEDTFDVPVRRFPTWYLCPECDRLDAFWKFGAAWTDPTCQDCPGEPRLVPSRFVVACVKGHLDDFPYWRWVHLDQAHPQGDKSSRLRMIAGGMSAGLSDISIVCGCGASRDMEGAFSRHAMQQMGKCRGRRPWISGEEGCEEFPRALQRGASNVWFSVAASAISIPPWSEGAFRVLDRHWKVLRAVPDVALPEVVREIVPATGAYSVEDLVEAARQRKGEEGVGVAERTLKEQEFEALRRGRPEVDRLQQFVCTPAPSPGLIARDYFQRIQQVTRLREVKALTSFTRLIPPSDNPEEQHDDRRAPLADVEMDWLPAIEVTGEGVYLELSDERLSVWEEREEVLRRVASIEENWRRLADRGRREAPVVSPRGVLIHSLAHLLIDQWALECGYPTASLTERLYVSDTMASLLVYTATTDSAGSLGGVVAMTDGDRLDSSLVQAVTRAGWCSSDPLCMEGAGRGVDSLNLAACHACMLLPETSCEERNVFLDRALLVGTPGAPEIGFFHELLPD